MLLMLVQSSNHRGLPSAPERIHQEERQLAVAIGDVTPVAPPFRQLPHHLTQNGEGGVYLAGLAQPGVKRQAQREGP